MSNDIQTAIDAGRLLAEIQSIDGRKFAVAPNDSKLVDLEHLQVNPARKRGNTTALTVESFVELVKRHAEVNSAIYYDPDAGKFLAVLNDSNAMSIPEWRDHTISYAAPKSPEWLAWTAGSGKQMSQESFAKFIEDNLPDIVRPAAADMLDISRTLEAKKSVDFAASLRLDNGQHQLTYEETIKGTAAKGRLEIPETFEIGIPALQGGARYAITARLRYRIGSDKHLMMWYELVRPHKVWDDVMGNAVKDIADGTQLPLYAAKV